MKAARKVVEAVLAIEFENDIGRINAIGVALAFLLILFFGIHAVYEETISRLLPHGTPYDFPVVTVGLIFVGAFVICVIMVALLAPLLPRRDDDRGR